MEWMDRLNQAVQYLEEHLTEEIHYEEAARIACWEPGFSILR